MGGYMNFVQMGGILNMLHWLMGVDAPGQAQHGAMVIINEDCDRMVAREYVESE